MARICHRHRSALSGESRSGVAVLVTWFCGGSVANGGKNGVGLHYMNKTRPFFPPLITRLRAAVQGRSPKGGAACGTRLSVPDSRTLAPQEKAGIGGFRRNDGKA